MSKSSLLSRRTFLVQGALAGAANALTTAPSQAPTPPADASPPTPNPPPVTRILADWLVACPQSAVPDSVRKEAVRSIVNWLGVTVGGSNQQAVVRALSAVLPFSTSGSAHLFGRSETLDPLRAAWLTGISSHVLDYDDTHLETIIHPAGPVASAIFALAQSRAKDRPLSGADLLHAFILGTEIECRLGKAIYPSHYDMGWHITGTCGAFGAAAACGRILGLNVLQMQWALGIAATEAAGLKIMFGSMSKSLNIGRAAENGLLAALLAAKNFTSSDEGIEGKDGYIFAASREHNYAPLIDGLGQHYEIALNTYKPFACGIVIHPVIDAVIQLRSEHSLKSNEIRSIAIRCNPLVLELTGKKTPTTGLEAKFSVFHSAAIALIRGFAGEKEYTDQAALDPEVVALRLLVTVSTDPSIRTDEAYVTITTTSGHAFTKHIDHAIGSVQNPLTDKDLSFKFIQLATGILPPAQIEKLLATAWNLPEMHNAGDLPRLGALA